MQSPRGATQRDAVTLVLIIVTAILALCFIAGTATAQVKLGGKVKSAAAKSLPASVAPATGGVKIGVVTFDERVLEITAERLEQFMAGLDAEQEMVARMKAQDVDAIDRANAAADAAWGKEMAVYDAKMEEHRKCTGAITRDLEQEIAPDVPTEKDQAKLEAVAARIKAAKEAGNMTEMRRLLDSVVAATNPAATRMTGASNKAAARAGSECGPLPVKPASPERKAALTWNDVTNAGARASGMNSTQYAIFRERVAPYVLSNGKSSDMMYTPSELGALQEKSEALAKYGSALKET